MPNNVAGTTPINSESDRYPSVEANSRLTGDERERSAPVALQGHVGTPVVVQLEEGRCLRTFFFRINHLI